MARAYAGRSLAIRRGGSPRSPQATGARRMSAGSQRRAGARRVPDDSVERPSPRRLVTRFQKLAAATVVTAILLVTIGVIVRATASGRRLPELARLLRGPVPAAASDGYQVWIEWIHRTVAVIIGFEDHRAGDPRLRWTIAIGARSCGRRSPPCCSSGSRPGSGRETVRLGNSGESVTAHLASAMALVGLLVYPRPVALSRRGSPAAAASGSRCSPRSARRATSRCSCSART